MRDQESDDDHPNPNIETRIEKLKKEVEALTGDSASWDVTDDCPPEVEEAFWRNVIAFESARWVQPLEVLTSGGVVLPDAAELSDSDLSAKLWEVIESLAMLGVYLHNTNHLSDRELYTHLINESLREESVLAPGNPDCAYHIDLLGSGSDEHSYLYLKYYADDEYRNHWARQYPGDEIPAHEEPEFDRDRLLPQAPF